MEYYAIYSPSAVDEPDYRKLTSLRSPQLRQSDPEHYVKSRNPINLIKLLLFLSSPLSSSDPEDFVFENKSDLLAKLKPFKDARFKSFKTRVEALRFAEIGFPLQQLQQTNSMIESIKCELDTKIFFLHNQNNQGHSLGCYRRHGARGVNSIRVKHRLSQSLCVRIKSRKTVMSLWKYFVEWKIFWPIKKNNLHIHTRADDENVKESEILGVFLFSAWQSQFYVFHVSSFCTKLQVVAHRTIDSELIEL